MKKVKEALTEVVAALVLVSLLATFVCMFLFVDQYFWICIFVGILATLITAAILLEKEVIHE